MNGRNAVIPVLVAVVGFSGIAVIVWNRACPLLTGSGTDPVSQEPVSPLKRPENSLVLHLETAYRTELPFVRIEDPTAANGTAIEVPPKAGKAPGAIELRFDLPKAGIYSLWVRAYWGTDRKDECSNSVIVKLDDRMPTTAQDGTYRRWHWVQVRVPGRFDGAVTLGAGAHTILLKNREDGIKIDQLFVAPWYRDEFERYVPQNIE